MWLLWIQNLIFFMSSWAPRELIWVFKKIDFCVTLVTICVTFVLPKKFWDGHLVNSGPFFGFKIFVVVFWKCNKEGKSFFSSKCDSLNFFIKTTHFLRKKNDNKNLTWSPREFWRVFWKKSVVVLLTCFTFLKFDFVTYWLWGKKCVVVLLTCFTF